MVVAVAGGPPRCDAVDQFAAVGEHDAAALRVAATASGGAHGLHLRIGQPDVVEAGGVPVRRAVAFRLFSLVLPDIRRFHATAMRSLDEFACGKLAALERAHLRRTLVVTGRDGIWVERGGRRLLSFSCNDYLNLSQHPAIIEAARSRRSNATASAPAPRGSSPAIIRSTPNWRAGWRGSRAPRPPACSAPAISPIPASSRRWSGDGDLILVDELSHACIHAGARAAAARRCSAIATTMSATPQALLAAASRQSRPRADRHRRRVLHGRRSARRSPNCRRWRSAIDAWLMVDDAHGLGVVGDGRGSALPMAGADVPLQMGTLSKAIGAYGGYLCASQPVIDLMRTRARTLHLFDRPAAAGRRRRDRRARPDRARAGLRRAAACARRGCSPARCNLPEAQSAIVPVIVGERRSGARGLGTAGGRRLSGGRRSGRRPCRPAPRGCALPSRALHPDDEIERLAGIVRTRVLGAIRERNLHHRDRHRRRQDLRRRVADPAFARRSATRSTPSSRSSAASIRRRPRPAIPASCSKRSACR